MAKRITSRRFLAIALVLAVGALGVHAAAHFHAKASDEQHCRVCQIGNSAIPQPPIEVTVQPAFPTSRFTLAEELTPYLEASRTPSIPRAPPA